MAQEQFHIPFPQSVVAAGYTVRASVAFAPRDNAAALPAVRDDLRRFYALVAAANDQPFDPDHAGDLELDYWIVHRELALAQAADDTPLVDSLARLHAALFGAGVAAMRPSAVSRARAAWHVDRITGRRSEDLEADWRLVYFYLRRCYEQIRAVI